MNVPKIWRRRKDKPQREKVYMGISRRLNEYTQLVVSRECILVKCENGEFRERGSTYPNKYIP